MKDTERTGMKILGEQWTINETQKLENADGYCDYSIKEIKICNTLDKQGTDEDEYQDVQQYKRKVTRHEIIHALFMECGLTIPISDVHTEKTVDWFAAMYPKIKAIFKELEIED